jgi:hypothetical protein
MGPLVPTDPALALVPPVVDPLEPVEPFEPVEEPELPPDPPEPPDPPDPPDDGDGFGNGDGESVIFGRGVTLGTGPGIEIEAAGAPLAFPPISPSIGATNPTVNAIANRRPPCRGADRCLCLMLMGHPPPLANLPPQHRAQTRNHSEPNKAGAPPSKRRVSKSPSSGDAACRLR